MCSFMPFFSVSALLSYAQQEAHWQTKCGVFIEVRQLLNVAHATVFFLNTIWLPLSGCKYTEIQTYANSKHLPVFAHCPILKKENMTILCVALKNELGPCLLQFQMSWISLLRGLAIGMYSMWAVHSSIKPRLSSLLAYQPSPWRVIQLPAVIQIITFTLMLCLSLLLHCSSQCLSVSSALQW